MGEKRDARNAMYAEKKEKAKRLWQESDLKGKEIAEKIGIAEQTFWHWRAKGNWKRNSKTKNNINSNLIENIEDINSHFNGISTNEILKLICDQNREIEKLKTENEELKKFITKYL